MTATEWVRKCHGNQRPQRTLSLCVRTIFRTFAPRRFEPVPFPRSFLYSPLASFCSLSLPLFALASVVRSRFRLFALARWSLSLVGRSLARSSLSLVGRSRSLVALASFCSPLVSYCSPLVSCARLSLPIARLSLPVLAFARSLLALVSFSLLPFPLRASLLSALLCSLSCTLVPRRLELVHELLQVLPPRRPFRARPLHQPLRRREHFASAADSCPASRFHGTRLEIYVRPRQRKFGNVVLNVVTVARRAPWFLGGMQSQIYG